MVTDPDKSTNFAGVTREATTFVTRSLVNRPMTTVDDDETEQKAFMSMVVVQQPIAKNNFLIMPLQNKISVLGYRSLLEKMMANPFSTPGVFLNRYQESILRNLPSPWTICSLNLVLALLKPLQYL
jgi:hypothetical protein